MEIRIFQTAAEVTAAAAQRVLDLLKRQPTSVLGLPAGRTPLGLYRTLATRHARGDVDFSRACTFNVDEFVGLEPTDRGSFHRFMDRHFFDRVNIPPQHIHILDGLTPDLAAECARFEQAIRREGGIDLQILGIGENGHIGFNEPGTWLHARTHRVRLRPETRRANAGAFGGSLRSVPREALSMGMATILGAKAIVLIATGASKARAVQLMSADRITTMVPASFLQLHGDVEVILDHRAASRLRGAFRSRC